jgi:hypothetical protein
MDIWILAAWFVKIRIYKTIILLVALYGCETWSLILREEHRLRLFENRVLRRIFGPKRPEVAGGWRKLLNEELRNLYTSPSIIKMIRSRRMRWAGHVARMLEKLTCPSLNNISQFKICLYYYILDCGAV